jgi:hypothetical protein
MKYVYDNRGRKYEYDPEAVPLHLVWTGDFTNHEPTPKEDVEPEVWQQLSNLGLVKDENKLPQRPPAVRAMKGKEKKGKTTTTISITSRAAPSSSSAPLPEVLKDCNNWVVNVPTAPFITYGVGACGLCGGASHGTGGIPESNESRLLITEIVVALDKENQKERGFMVGVLFANGKRLFATSGNNADLLSTTALKWGFHGPTDCIITWPIANLTVSRGGAALTPDVCDAKTETGIGDGRLARLCAGPKLIEYARRKNWLVGNLFMSEMWYGKQETATWHHKKPAPSCPGCQILLPALLCTQPPPPPAATAGIPAGTTTTTVAGPPASGAPGGRGERGP